MAAAAACHAVRRSAGVPLTSLLGADDQASYQFRAKARLPGHWEPTVPTSTPHEMVGCKV